jgi:hypothetical protein
LLLRILVQQFRELRWHFQRNFFRQGVAFKAPNCISRLDITCNWNSFVRSSEEWPDIFDCLSIFLS